MSGRKGRQYVDLFRVIDDKLADDPRYCSSGASGGGSYWDWEAEIAKPALEALGYTEVTFNDGERDSFGPLTRIVGVTHKSGRRHYLIYG